MEKKVLASNENRQITPSTCAVMRHIEASIEHVPIKYLLSAQWPDLFSQYQLPILDQFCAYFVALVQWVQWISFWKLFIQPFDNSLGLSSGNIGNRIKRMVIASHLVKYAIVDSRIVFHDQCWNFPWFEMDAI